jgi:hypothetical protein
VNIGELWAPFDTLQMGRPTHEAAVARLGRAAMQAMKNGRRIPHSASSEATECNSTIPELNRSHIHALRAQNGKDIWLFGGSKVSSRKDLEERLHLPNGPLLRAS